MISFLTSTVKIITMTVLVVARYYEGPIVRGSGSPRARWSEGPMVRGPDSPRAGWFEGPMVRGPDGPRIYGINPIPIF